MQVIHYATTFDSKDIHLWSGLGYYLGKMLQDQGHEVNYLNKLQLRNELLHKTRKYVGKIFNESYSPNFSLKVARELCEIIQGSVPEGSVILSPNTILLSQLSRNYKTVLFTDATFDLLLDFYPAFTNIRQQYIRQAEEIERQALQRADMLIYSSQWAADSAVNHYGADPSKIALVPFGPNMDVKLKPGELDTVISSRLRNLQEVNLLLVAVAWYRKGGDYALSVVDRLNKAGITAKLHIVGIKKLPAGIDTTHIIDHGYISKGTAKGQLYLADLMKKVHFLLLPSRADCTPVAVSEANSFGLPALVSNVGGNPSVVANDVNGRVFDFARSTTECVEFISSMVGEPLAYGELCSSSFMRFKNELNWDMSGRKVTSLLKRLKSGVPNGNVQ